MGKQFHPELTTIFLGLAERQFADGGAVPAAQAG
jgi:hypothetical protein